MEEKVNQNNEREQFTESDPLKENGGEFKEKKSFKENFLYAVKNVTVEPVMICYVVSCVLAILTGQNLNLEKACRVNLNFTKDICDSLKSQTLEAENEYERDVQILVARAMAWRTLITATLPCITALFVGSWSDKTGYRKIFIIIPIIGQTLSCFNGILHYYFFFELSLEAYVFSDALIDGLSGSFCVCFLTIFSYISTITTVENRTFRLGLINFSMSVGFPIGMGLSGVLLKYSGFYSVYSFCAVIHVLNFLYTVFILKDPKRDEGQKQHDKKGLVHLTRLYFDIANIKNTLLVVFKKGSNNRRLRMFVYLAVAAILFGPTHGELAVMYISTRYRFNWDEVKFGIFQAYNFVMHTLGTIISVAIFSKWLRWHDAVLGIFSTISKIASSFVYCFAQNERILYLAPVIDMLNGTSLLAIRSIVSKLVATDELGKVNSIFGLCENLTPLLYIPMYTKVYTSTMEVLPGAVFLVGSAMVLPTLFVFIWLLYEHRRNIHRTKKQEANMLKEN
ncbi:proton-coupled folate transporter-like [Leptidea sinapis]|uniref:proton-coupled folate transporter-like n=1 Tax=Leptidea sinapis TaxID=189913 RepID=UPI002133BBE5|nr:proton-coupled folate transporter-like [Leptidea sinapis]